MISLDRDNHCLRLVNFTKSPPETSTFAGKCTVPAAAYGHRLETARLILPDILAADSFNPSVFVYDSYRDLVMINLTTDELTKIHTFAHPVTDMRFFRDGVLHFIQPYQVLSFNINSKEVNVIAGYGSGKATGLFEFTRFYNLFGLLTWTYSGEEVLLVADRDNDRLFICFPTLFSFQTFNFKLF